MAQPEWNLTENLSQQVDPVILVASRVNISQNVNSTWRWTVKLYLGLRLLHIDRAVTNQQQKIASDRTSKTTWNCQVCPLINFKSGISYHQQFLSLQIDPPDHSGHVARSVMRCSSQRFCSSSAGISYWDMASEIGVLPGSPRVQEQTTPKSTGCHRMWVHLVYKP